MVAAHTFGAAVSGHTSGGTRRLFSCVASGARRPDFAAPRLLTATRQRSYTTRVARPASFAGLCSSRAHCLGNRAVPELQRSGRLPHGARHAVAPPLCRAGGLPRRAGLPGPAPHLDAGLGVTALGPTCPLAPLPPSTFTSSRLWQVAHAIPPPQRGEGRGVVRAGRELAGSSAARRAPRKRRLSGL